MNAPAPTPPSDRTPGFFDFGRTLRLRRALQIVWRGSRGFTLAGIALSVIQGILPLLSLYLLKMVVDSVSSGLALPAAQKTAALGRSGLWIALLAGVSLLNVVFHLVSTYVRDAQSQSITDYVHNLIHAKSVAVDLAYYEDPRYYDTLHRAQQEAPYRPAMIVSDLLKMTQSAISLAAVTVILVSVHWAIAVVLVLASIPGFAIKVRYSGRWNRRLRRRSAPERLALYLHQVLTGDQYAKEVRLFELGEDFRARYAGIRAQLREEQLTFSRRRSRAELAAQAVSILAVIGALAFTARSAILGAITIGSLVMYFQAFQRSQGFIQDFLGGLAGLYDDSLFLGYFDEFMELRPAISDPPSPRTVPAALSQGIAFEDVTFRYPGAERQALNGVSLTLLPGTVTALVGHNGSGKTTLVKLLCRLYDPESGRVRLDGADYKDYRPADLRRLFGVVPQDASRFYLTVAENIGLSALGSAPDPARVERAARQAGAEAFIHRLPQGYDSVLGKLFEKGEDLSVGEWQKIALARAFYRDAPIIVLDEPTSAMDAEAEAEVFDAFKELIAGRTALLISHRFSTVRGADVIHVLDAGKVVESGDHAALMALGGIYARMFTLQAGHYR
ncbi:MAG TPA: ABC transporter ATP-binding protein [Deltaproteobacteria bacterium]|nr:ABC transporter ATP-binding protein [Deltaproteobacteria bacterium]